MNKSIISTLNLVIFYLVTIVLGLILAAEEKWVWGGDENKKIERIYSPRYLVHEYPDNQDFNNGGFRPQNNGPYDPFNRPIVSNHQGNNGILGGPGGPTGIIGRPPHGEGNFIPEGIPGLNRNDPRYKDFDVCTCKYSFNCPHDGVKFGSCLNNKQYCCYNSRKYPQLVPGRFNEGSRPFNLGSSFHRPAQNFIPSFDYSGYREPHGIFPGGYRNPFQGSRYPNRDDLNFQRPQDKPYIHGSGFGIHSERVDPYQDVSYFARSLNRNDTERVQEQDQTKNDH